MLWHTAVAIRLAEVKKAHANEKALETLNTIFLSQAHDQILSVLIEHPGAAATVNSRWIGRLQEARAADISDSTDDSPDEADDWHADRCSNLILREALSVGKLTPYVRDSETGEALQLGRSGWLPGERNPLPALPPNLPDHITIDDSRLLLLSTAHGFKEHNPVFLLAEEFKSWLMQFFARWLDTSINSEGTQVRSHRLEATKLAINAIWGTNGPPAGLLRDMRTRQINNWLETNKRAKVSSMTIKRAIKDMYGPDRS